jgi:hypothetical protein
MVVNLEDRVNKICVTKSGYVYVAGWFYGTSSMFKAVNLSGASRSEKHFHRPLQTLKILILSNIKKEPTNPPALLFLIVKPLLTLDNGQTSETAFRYTRTIFFSSSTPSITSSSASFKALGDSSIG